MTQAIWQLLAQLDRLHELQAERESAATDKRQAVQVRPMEGSVDTPPSADKALAAVEGRST